MKAAIPKAMALAAAAGSLGGCASFASERPKVAYFIVPCNTPGAFPAQPFNAADGIPAVTPQEPETDAPKEEATCLIGAADTTLTWIPAYSGYGYAPHNAYSRLQHGGIGIVAHGGGHHGGHHGGRHGRH